MEHGSDVVEWARDAAHRLLAPLGARWHHVAGVGRTADRVAVTLPASERPVLVAAAYLHDIGYAPVLRRLGAHQLDGAAWISAQGEAYWRLACLVAHHSESRFELTRRGLGNKLAEYPREESPVMDALVYSDLTTGPSGQRMSLSERITEVHARYGPSLISDALTDATPHLAAAVERTEAQVRATA
ncbi:MAG: HD domain-containing protein [Micromonosporaceae bacterium]